MNVSRKVKSAAAVATLSVSLMVANAGVANAEEAPEPQVDTGLSSAPIVSTGDVAATQVEPVVKESDARAQEAAEADAAAKNEQAEPADLSSATPAAGVPAKAPSASNSVAAAPAAGDATEDPQELKESRLDGTIQSFVSETQTKEDTGWTGFEEEPDENADSNATSGAKRESASSSKTVATGEASSPRIRRAASASGASGGTGVVSDKAGGLELSFQVKDETGSYVDLLDYLRNHVDVSVTDSNAVIVSLDGTDKHHGLDYLWSTVTYRFTINDRPASVPDAVGQYRVRAQITLSDGTVLQAFSNVFKIYPKDVNFSDIVAEKEQAREAGKQNEYFIDTPYISTLKGLGLEENQGATEDEIKDMSRFEMPEGDTWINGSSEKGVYIEVGNATNTDSEALVVKKGSHLTLNNMKFNSSVRIIVEEGATLTLRQSVVFGKIEVHGTLTAPNGSTVTDTIYMRPGSTLEDAKIASHARYLTDGNTTKPESDVVIVTDGDVRVEGNVQVEGDSGSSERQGQIPFVVSSGTVTLAPGSTLTTTGGSTDLVYNQDGGDGILMLDGTAIKGMGSVVTKGGDSTLGSAGSGVAVATLNSDGTLAKGKGSAEVSVASLDATGGNSAQKGESTLPFDDASRTAGDGIGAGVDTSGTTQVVAKAGQGENAGSENANAGKGVVSSKEFAGVAEAMLSWQIDGTGDYTGYSISVGVFDADGKQVGTTQKLDYGKSATFTGLDKGKTYTARVLSIADADGNAVTGDFTNTVDVQESVSKGAEESVWSEKAAGLEAGDSGVAITYESNGKTYLLGVDENGKLIGKEAQFKDGKLVDIDANFTWDVEDGGSDYQGNKNLLLSISGQDNYLQMGYNGPSMRSYSSYANHNMVWKDGTIRGNDSYREYLNATDGNISGDYSNGTSFTIWQSKKEAAETKTVSIVVKSTPVATHTVTWVDADGNELEVDRGVRKGTQASYDGATPTKAGDAQYSYTFKGWDVEPGAVTGDVTYTAQFDQTVNSYKVVWLNEDGTELESDTVKYGDTPVYGGATPTKASDDKYSYTFAGWKVQAPASPAKANGPRRAPAASVSTGVSPVTGNVTYVATFKADPLPAADPTKPAVDPNKGDNPADPNNAANSGNSSKQTSGSIEKSPVVQAKATTGGDTGDNAVSETASKADAPATGDEVPAAPFAALFAALGGGFAAFFRRMRKKTEE